MTSYMLKWAFRWHEHGKNMQPVAFWPPAVRRWPLKGAHRAAVYPSIDAKKRAIATLLDAISFGSVSSFPLSLVAANFYTGCCAKSPTQRNYDCQRLEKDFDSCALSVTLLEILVTSGAVGASHRPREKHNWAQRLRAAWGSLLLWCKGRPWLADCPIE